MCQLGSMCKWNWTGGAEKHEMVKTRRATRKIQLDPRTTYCRACTSVSEMLSSLQLLAATASPSHSFQGDALQRETLSIVYQHCPADLQLLVKTKRYSLQHSEQHNKNYKEDWSSPQFKGKSTKTLWHLLQASLQQKLHHGILEWLGLKGSLKIIVSTHPAIHHTRLLSTPFSLALNIFKNEAFTVSLGHLFQPLSKEILPNI